jgi:hypothetical protein
VPELSDLVSDRPVPVRERSWTNDKKALLLRALILLAVIAGVIETLLGLRDAWAQGANVRSTLDAVAQQAWALLPFALVLFIAAFRISKRSLITLLVTSLLCWFMSTGYFNLDEMGIVLYIIPFVQLTFIAGALAVMFTFWLLRKPRSSF